MKIAIKAVEGEMAQAQEEMREVYDAWLTLRELEKERNAKHGKKTTDGK